jgi:hypothetical protein
MVAAVEVSVAAEAVASVAAVVVFTAVVSAAAGFMAVASGAAVLHYMAAGSEAVRSTAAAFVPRGSSMAAAIATDIVTPITGRISITTGITSIGASTRRPITATRTTMATGIATAA